MEITGHEESMQIEMDFFNGNGEGVIVSLFF